MSKSDPQSPYFSKNRKNNSLKKYSLSKKENSNKFFELYSIESLHGIDRLKNSKKSIDTISVSTRSKPRKDTSLKNGANIFRIKRFAMEIDAKLHRSDSSPESPTRKKIH